MFIHAYVRTEHIFPLCRGQRGLPLLRISSCQLSGHVAQRTGESDKSTLQYSFRRAHTALC